MHRNVSVPGAWACRVRPRRRQNRRGATPKSLFVVRQHTFCTIYVQFHDRLAAISPPIDATAPL